MAGLGPLALPSCLGLKLFESLAVLCEDGGCYPGEVPIINMGRASQGADGPGYSEGSRRSQNTT